MLRYLSTYNFHLLAYLLARLFAYLPTCHFEINCWEYTYAALLEKLR